MKDLPPTHKPTHRNIAKLRRNKPPHDIAPPPETPEIPAQLSLPKGYEVRVICLYPSVSAGKLARKWLETALHNTAPHAHSCVEYFNYAVLDSDGISWGHVMQRIHPDIILMVGDGNHTLSAGLRNSLRSMLSNSRNGSRPLVIFRDLDPEPTLNTQTLLDYVSALTQRNSCELNAMNGNGPPISCFRNPRPLLRKRRLHE